VFENTPLIIVEDFNTLVQVAKRLGEAPVIGIDTEGDSFYHYRERVCLIQFSDANTDYIVDPLACKELSPLTQVLADPNIVKVLHGGDYDIVCLRRDYGFQLHGVFDTLIAAQLIGLPRFGLGDLVDTYFQYTMDKGYQRHNWSKRPLLEEHLEYARGDTHYLIPLRELLLEKVNQIGRLAHMEEECRLLEKREWQGRDFDPDGYLRVKGAAKLSDRELRVLRRLYIYRDSQAREMDRPPFKVFPDKAMLEIATRQPQTETEFERLFQRQRAMRRRYGRAMLEAVHKGLDDDFAIPKPTRSTKAAGYKRRLRGRAADRVLQALKKWRNNKIDSAEEYTTYTVASNATLKCIAESRPFDKTELSEIPNVRNWQLLEFGEEILDLLEHVAPRNTAGLGG
jgi:ribonuclease D